ncbi:MAG: N-acetylglucosamine-6-phosphate deacetylase [Anaerolineae bacterium]|nr:N-acetylglucosamine-6-phosphate deacetylase [Anaerolineae bacterium]
MTTYITGGTLATPYQALPGQALVVDGDKITAVVAADQVPADANVIDASGMWVVPGLIDVHVHGSDGADTMDATPEALHTMARFFAKHGVTGYFPTTMSAPADAIKRAIENVASCPQPDDGAQHLGVHVEGPYLNTDYPGAQPPSVLRLPDPAEYRFWLESGVVKLITLAPEVEGAHDLIREGVARGVEFAAGHTGAEYDQVQAAVGIGLRQATHTFSAMLGLHHRRPGTVGAVLTDDRIYAQLIGDGIHTHPSVVKLLARAKGNTRTILITDAMRAAGMPDGEYDLGGTMVRVQDGVARLSADVLAGSTATLDAVLRNMMNFAGVSLVEALPMATAVPAEAMGLSGRKGVLAVGADADVVLLDVKYQVALTMVAGRVVYRAS